MSFHKVHKFVYLVFSIQKLKIHRLCVCVGVDGAGGGGGILAWFYFYCFKKDHISSSKVSEAIRTISIFLRNAKQTIFTLLKAYCTRNCCLCCFCLLVFVLLVALALICVFVCAKSFRKKNRPAWNCLDSLILLYYWRVLLSTRLSSPY